MEIEYVGDPDEDRPEASVVRFEETKPVAHPRSNLGSNADRVVWEFETPPRSRWFDKGQLLKLDPGEYPELQSHLGDVEGELEFTFRVFEGRAALRTEYWDTELERFDTGVVPAGAAYQFGNPGTEPLWIGLWATVGEDDLRDASWQLPADREGATEEYERINAARRDRDLPADDVSYDGDPDDDRAEVIVERFAETKPVPISLQPEVGNNSARADWFTGFPEATYWENNTVVKMEPGEHLVFHSHFQNEGPYEELYWVMEGDFVLRTEYWDTTLDRFDFAHFPTGTAHSIGNVGTETGWFAAFSTRGGVEREDASDQGVFDEVEPKDRPTVVEEYKRIMAARKQRGLDVPNNVSVEIQDE